MKNRLLLSIMMIFFFAQIAWSYTGREIMEKAQDITEPESAITKITMFVHKGKRVMEKEFNIITKRFNNDESKTLISFTRPTKIKLLMHSNKGKEDNMWLRLSSGKVKRIASMEKGKAFVNSHISYEDMVSREIDDYDYKNLGDAKALNVDCYRIEAVKKEKGKHAYDKTILFVRKSDFFLMRIDFYKKGNLFKFLENHDIKPVSGILTPYSISMQLANGKGKTELKVKSVNYNQKIKNTKFNKEALR